MATMTLSEELTWRGFVNQSTFANITELDEKTRTFYHGFDASADSQTVGNLAGMMFDKVFMRHGYKAVVLAGGATSLIGDPGGKDKERVLQNEETIAHNIACAQEQLQKVFRGQQFTMVNNLDWTKTMSVLEFLRDIGKHFSMTSLVQRDYIAKRLGQGGAGISYTEFSYTLLQGMDFLHLFDTMDVTLQLGGADQWGNCLSGVDLIRRARAADTHVITMPLIINKATGKKFGKSEAGAVWLDPARTSPTQFYQFWINVDDESAEDYLKIYTELDKPSIDGIMAEHRHDPRQRVAQTRLALEVTQLVHGDDEARTAQDITAVLTGKKPVGELTDAALTAMRREVPAATLAADDGVVQALAKSGLAASTSEARQLLKDGAVYVNGQPATADTLAADQFQNGRLLLRKGKVLKNTALIERS